MAFTNPNKPAGLVPVFHLQGLNWNSAVHMYAIPAGDTHAFYPGDLVDLQANCDAATGLRQITLATAGSTAVGVVAAVGIGNAGPAGAGGPYINSNDLSKTFRPSGAQTPVYYAAVIDDPYVVFEIQEGGTGTNLAAGTATTEANILYAAPATGVFVSGTTLDNGSLGSSATKNLKFYSFKQAIDNHFVTTPATGGGSQKWWVLINNHRYRAGIAGV